MTVNKEYEILKVKIEEHLATYFVNEDNDDMRKFSEIINYSLLSGGKRLRPILLLKSAEVFSANLDEALELACALEMIHTYSLIHDDLPAMDDDMYRRGRLTPHVVYGEAMAILSGDALLNKAYEVIFEVLARNPKALNAAKLIASNAGPDGMIAGQVVDIATENTVITDAMLDYIIINKTTKLISAAMVSGALLGNSSEEDLKQYSQAAYHIGYSFQLVDDYLDVTGDLAIVGKATGRDEALDKNTYVKQHGLNQTLLDAQWHLESAEKFLDSIKLDNMNLIYDIINYLKSRKK
jgi:geranylgeranyl diphosphate synthase type II